MALFGRRTYDRADSLARASKAIGRGKRKQAIAEYRRVLEQEPGNPVILAKLAPLLAETRQLKEAGEKFRAAGKQYENQGFPEKALGVYAQAVKYLPRSVELWETISGLYLARSRRADALSALLEGRSHFRRGKQRPLAIRLLRGAVQVEPWQLEATLDLARQLRKSGGRAEADRLYQGLCERKRGAHLRRVRGAMFRRSPTPAALWRWLRAALAGR
ncbi:MAG: tetratricopeptide repeat protein [Myxococcota bacterium]